MSASPASAARPSAQKAPLRQYHQHQLQDPRRKRPHDASIISISCKTFGAERPTTPASASSAARPSEQKALQRQHHQHQLRDLRRRKPHCASIISIESPITPASSASAARPSSQKAPQRHHRHHHQHQLHQLQDPRCRNPQNASIISIRCQTFGAQKAPQRQYHQNQLKDVRTKPRNAGLCINSLRFHLPGLLGSHSGAA